MGFCVDYENEIIISDSTSRMKRKEEFGKDVKKAIYEIYRVLKKEKYFVFTYHSLSGFEWMTITNSLIESGFEVTNCELLLQKTFTPRQLNRVKTIKGDLLVTCKKSDAVATSTQLNSFEQDKMIKSMFIDVLKNGACETNDVIVEFLKIFFSSRMIVTDLNIISRLEQVATFNGNGWMLNENI